MKQVIKIKEVLGPALHTRAMVESFVSGLSVDNEYLLDMEGVEQISRSAADELYNLENGNIKVHIINMSEFVAKMMDIVTKGRFLPRERQNGKSNIIYCPTIQSAIDALNSFA